jgi:hypothetical protein
VADRRPTTAEERFDLISEASELAAAASLPTGNFMPDHVSIDPVLAALSAHAEVDGAGSSGGARRGTVRWAARSVLAEQRTFNRLAIQALEDLTARLDEVEARLSALEASPTPSEHS